MFRITATCLLLICSSSLLGQESPFYRVLTPIVVEHQVSTEVQALFHDGSGFNMLKDRHFYRADGVTVIAPPVGQYVLIYDGTVKIIEVTEEGKPEPDPEPRPDPEPTPDPEPEPPGPEPEPEPIEIAWAVWIYEQADSLDHVDETNVRQSAETREFLDSKGIKFASYDDDQEAAKPFLDKVKKLPALFLMKDKSTYTVYSAPESVDELKEMVRATSNG